MKYFTLSCLFLFLAVASSSGQTDSLMQVAKDLIKQDKYAEAEKVYITILDRNGTNNDVRFALGLLYSWSKQYDKAESTFMVVIKSRPGSKEVYVAAINNELWAEKYSQALTLAEKAASIFPEDADILIRKAKALNNLHRSDEAALLLSGFQRKFRDNREINDLLENIKSGNRLNSIGISYTYDYFKNDSPWQLAYLQYKRKTAFGAVIGRFNYANRFGSRGYQVEADAYPALTSKSYAYVNAGYSPSTLFPVFRLGMDYNRKFPHAYEASLGFRYLDFRSSRVMIYTGHIGKYIGNYWIAFRPYVVPDSTTVSLSGFITARRYFATADDYIGLQIGYGTSPDDRYRLLTNQNLRLTGYNSRISYNHLFGKRWILNVNGAYAYEEYFTSLFKSKITFDMAISYLF